MGKWLGIITYFRQGYKTKKQINKIFKTLSAMWVVRSVSSTNWFFAMLDNGDLHQCMVKNENDITFTKQYL